MIEVKSRFGGWRAVGREQAYAFAKNIYAGAVALSGKTKMEYINSHVRGIKFREEDLRKKEFKYLKQQKKNGEN